MNIQDYSEIIVPVILGLITIVGGYVAKFTKTNSTARTLVQVLPEIAKSAIVAMEKAGVTNKIAGTDKMQSAITIVQATLKKAGITNADVTTIENALEKEFAIIKQEGTLDVYPQAVEAPTTTTTTTIAPTTTTTTTQAPVAPSEASTPASQATAPTAEASSTSTVASK